MLTRQFLLDVSDEIVVDMFAGGGGASCGIEQAIGRHVDVAINHDPEAVAMHQANHPQTKHHVCDIFDVDAIEVADGRRIGLLWASPDCKHFSKAKGGKPVEKKIRGLAWIVVKWVKKLHPLGQHPRVILLENVEEFQHWGPLTAEGMPCKRQRGRTFARWKAALERFGYNVDFREDRASDFGAPTIRKRLFLVARCDGQPIVFPEATHGNPESLPVRAKKLKPWRTAAECIDWRIPCPSIFERKRELADATKRRVAKGVFRYVIDNPQPFVVPTAAPFMVTIDNKSSSNGAHSPQAPLRTTTVENRHALVVAFLAQHNNHRGIVPSHGRPVVAPFSTVTAKGCQQTVVTSNLIKLRGTSKGAQSVERPLHTISAQGTHHAEVRAFLVKYFGTDQDPRLTEPMHTVTTKHRFGLVTVHGEDYAIVDIGLRMLAPRELYLAQGFPEDYIFEWGIHPVTGDVIELTQTAQIRMCGNSVSPVMAKAYALANYCEREPQRKAA